ncbi:hypothetical protein [Butyrivibrio sp. YAB3001]|uniref:hypothetical protein n=1 Tax=Butyrivibrio sp. YAB3001 TaxID=1520812 RepID=UPI0015880998|nr:hypothetical protein [Butyrivibrio sp. YAB3001]
MSNHREYKSGTTKASIGLEDYNASLKTEGSIAIELKNEKDGATQYIYARINGLDKCY